MLRPGEVVEVLRPGEVAKVLLTMRSRMREVFDYTTVVEKKQRFNCFNAVERASERARERTRETLEEHLSH